MLAWWATRDVGPPPLLLVRRVLKLAWADAERRGWLDLPLDAVPAGGAVAFDAIPVLWPDPAVLRLWAG